MYYFNKIQKTTGVDTDDVDYDPKDENDELIYSLVCFFYNDIRYIYPYE